MINTHQMDEQTEQCNKYTYDVRADREGQSIYLRWTNRQTRAINMLKMNEQTEKGNQYTYDRITDRQEQSIYLYKG
jgi:hypothetical protein